MKTIPLVLTLLAALTLGACASSRSGDVYSRDEARQEIKRCVKALRRKQGDKDEDE